MSESGKRALVRAAFLSLAVVVVAAWLFDRPDAVPEVNWVDAANAPVTFEANQGQTDPEVRFLARAPGYTAFFTPGRVVSTWREPGSETQARIEMKVVGANKDAPAEPLEKQHRRSNYFIGNDPAKWRRNVPHYGKVKFNEVYKGIDLVYHSPVTSGPDPQRTIEYDFVVSPGVDPSIIELSFEGVEKVAIDDQGGLLLASAAGGMHHRKPTVYQEIGGERLNVSGAFRALGERSVGFEVGDYDREYPLVIDPVQQVIILDHSSYLGGGSRDDAADIVMGPDGIYYVGSTESANFAAPPPAVQDALFGPQDMFFTRVSPDGATILNSTFIGGSASEEATCVAVDQFGNAYLVGFSNSPDFITTFGNGPQGLFDGTITVLSPDGSQILLSTTIGGPSGEDALGCAILSPADSNNVWLATTGRTNSSSGFPVQTNAFQPTYGGGAFDGFINIMEMEYDQQQDQLTFRRSHTTFLGGTATDVGESIYLFDSNSPGAYPTDTPGDEFIATPTPLPQSGGPVQGAVLLTTSSNGLTVGSNAFQDAPAGGSDFYIATFNYVNGTLNITGGTYSGGNQDEFGESITGNRDSILVTGYTTGTYPTTPSPFQPPPSGASISGVVTQFDIGLTQADWSSHVGGDIISQASDAVYTQDGCAVIVGQSLGEGLPITEGAILADPAGGTDGFIIIVCDNGRDLRYATLAGGPGGDSLVGVTADPFGNVHATGTSGAGWPTTPGAFQPTFGGAPFDATTLGVNRTGPFLGQRGFVGGADFQGPPARGGIGAGFGIDISDGIGLPSVIPLDTVINNTSITFLPPITNGNSAPLSVAGSAGKSQNAPIQGPLLFVSPTQLNFQIPWEVDISGGTVRVAVTANGVESAPIEIAVQEYAPQIFTFDFGPGRAVAINPDGSVAHPEDSIAGVTSRPAVPGDILTIFATGLGPTEPPAVTGDNSFNEDGEFVRRDTVSTPAVSIGGVPATLQFSGMSPEFVGVQQVNVFVPEGVTPGDEVPLVIEIEGLTSRDDVTIAVAAAN